MKRLYLRLFRLNWLVLLLTSFTFSFIFNYFISEFIQTDELFNQYIEEKYEDKYSNYDEFNEDLEELDFLEDSGDFSWEDFFIDIIYTFIKLIFTIPFLALFFLSGYFLTNKLHHVKYQVIFKAVLLSNFIFLLEPLSKAIYFEFIFTNHTFEDFLNFKPVHLIFFFDRTELPNWTIPFLELINLYEILFLFSVSYLIAYMYRKDVLRVLGITSLTYFIGFICWRLFLTYILKIF